MSTNLDIAVPPTTPIPITRIAASTAVRDIRAARRVESTRYVEEDVAFFFAEVVPIRCCISMDVHSYQYVYASRGGRKWETTHQSCPPILLHSIW